MNDHVLLNISTVTGKWFREFNFLHDLNRISTNVEKCGKNDSKIPPLAIAEMSRP